MAIDIAKLKKVVEIAKKGLTQGERDNAEKIARKACAELSIRYEDALAGKWPVQRIHIEINFGTYQPQTHQQSSQAWQNQQSQMNQAFQQAQARMRSEQDIRARWNPMQEKSRRDREETLRREKLRDYFRGKSI